MSQIRLLIVDDHEVVRLGLRTLLETEPDLRVVAEAGTAEEALVQTANHHPDVVILDIQLPGRSGLDACRDIRQKFPQSQVVMLTSSANENFALEALRAGAAGYVLKQVGGDELVRAVRAAHNGETALDPKTAARLVARLNELQKKTEADAFRDLSQREMEVLNLVARGWNNKEIAQALNLSEITARNYVTTIMEKLHLRNRVELAAYAIRNHIEERM
jgi:two-component system response regulator DevR